MPGVKAPNAPGVPRVSDSVAGTVPEASPFCWVAYCTTTLKDFVDELPLASVAVHVTGVVPMANFVPEAGVQATVGFGSCESVATEVYVTVAPLRSVVLTTTGAWSAMVGAVVSAAKAPDCATVVAASVTG